MGDPARGQAPDRDADAAQIGDELRGLAAASFAAAGGDPAESATHRHDAASHEEVLGPVLDAIRDLGRSVAGYESLGRCLIDVVDTAGVGIKERHAIVESLATLREELQALREQTSLVADAAIGTARATRELLRGIEEHGFLPRRERRHGSATTWLVVAGAALTLGCLVGHAATGRLWLGVAAIVALNATGCLVLRSRRRDGR